MGPRLRGDDALRTQTMPRVLILLTLPPNVREYYRSTLQTKFRQLDIEVVDHFSKATPAIGSADILITFGPMMKNEVFAAARQLKWVQALGTGVDGITD